MISKDDFDRITQKALKYPYTSMNYIDFDDCSDSEVLYDCDDLILLQDKSKTPAMLYFATNDFDSLINILSEIPGKLRLNFVPQEYAVKLKEIGFIEWAKFIDFWNKNLLDTAAYFQNVSEAEYLNSNECEDISILSKQCRLQSRGFEGESAEWFTEWLKENEVIILRNNSKIIGFCCVSIYNEGTTLWIREIAVDPDYQGKGIGKKLMEQAIGYGVEKGALKSFLAADLLNKNAIGLYEKYGFHAKNIDGELQMIKE